MPLDLFTKNPLPKVLPEEMQQVIDILKKSKTQEECLKKTYEILTKKYHGDRVQTYTRIFDVFTNNIDVLWKREGFLHCTNINYIMRILLIKSGFFTEEDLLLRWTQIWYFSPHQYLRITMKNSSPLDIDIWAYFCGVQFGDYAHGFYP